MSFAKSALSPSFHDEGHGFDVFGLHPPAIARLLAASAPVYDRYFRVDSRQAERIPATGPVILVANHGGMLPIDAAMLCLDVLRHTQRFPRAVADRFVPRLPLVGTMFARFGVVSGTRANVRRLLERDELIAVWPEGVSGPAKAFRQRYQIQEWRVGFAELAIRHRAAVVPVAIVGAEESWPLAAKLTGFHWFGVPYLPIPVSLVPLPVRIHIQYGLPIRFDRLAAEADDPEVVRSAAMRVRTVVEEMISELRAERQGVFR